MLEIEWGRCKKSKSLGRRIEQIEWLVEYRRCSSFSHMQLHLAMRGNRLSLRGSRKRSRFGVGSRPGCILAWIFHTFANQRNGADFANLSQPLHFQTEKAETQRTVQEQNMQTQDQKPGPLLFPMSIFLIGSQFHICECYQTRLTKYLNMILRKIW